MGMVHFVDGRVLELSPRDTTNFMVRLREGGVRMVMTRDTVPMVALIISNCPVAQVTLDHAFTPQPIITPEEKPPVKTEGTEDKQSIVEKEQEILQQIMAKSSCLHEPEKLMYMKVEGKKGTRYFPVCSFCGWRGKFVASDQLTDAVKQAAQTLQEE
jgi:hypothetical protein